MTRWSLSRRRLHSNQKGSGDTGSRRALVTAADPMSTAREALGVAGGPLMTPDEFNDPIDVI